MIDKTILAKIRKCLALGKSCNEHEAAAALAMARRLMDQYGIDEGMIELVEIQEATARACRTVRPPRWENVLAQTVCHALGVDNFLDARGDRVFVGRGPRSLAATYAFTVLFRQLKAARSAYVSNQLRRCKPGRKRARADVFCEGWASAVYRKVAELLPEPAADEAINQYLQVQYPGLVPIDSRAANAKRADEDYWRGSREGGAVELNVAVKGGDAPMLLA